MNVCFDLIRMRWFQNAVLQFLAIIFIYYWLQIARGFVATINELCQLLPTVDGFGRES